MISSFVRALISVFKARRKLTLENVALWQQIAVLRHSQKGDQPHTDTKLLIYGLFQEGRVLAQDGIRAFGLRSYFRTRRVPTVSECSN